MSSRLALRQYQRVGAQTGVEAASPHRLIQMLLGGALDRIARARGCMQQRDIAKQGENIGVAISIVSALRSSLDMEQGGEIAANLDRLYEYMGRRLLEANMQSQSELLEEVAALLREIKEGWDAIADQV